MTLCINISASAYMLPCPSMPSIHPSILRQSILVYLHRPIFPCPFPLQSTSAMTSWPTPATKDNAARPRYSYPYVQMPLYDACPSEKYNIRNLHSKRLTMKGINQTEQAGVAKKKPRLPKKKKTWAKSRLKGAVWMAGMDDDSAKAHIDPDPGPETA